MHSPSSSAATLLVFMWCCGQGIKRVVLREEEWRSDSLSPGLCQCRLRPVPGEGQGGRGVPVARDRAVTYPSSQPLRGCIGFPVLSNLILEPQSYFCFRILFVLTPLLLPGSHSKQKAPKQSPAFSDSAGSRLAHLKDLWGWVFTLRLLV